MKSYTHILWASAFSCVAFSVSASLSRADAPATLPTASTQMSETWKTSTLDELRGEINRIGESIREKVGSSEESKRKLDVVWTDPKYTSETIEEKRKVIRAAEAAIIKAQIELREEVAKLPEVVKMSADNDVLQQEITSLRQQKKALLQLLGARTKSDAPSN